MANKKSLKAKNSFTFIIAIIMIIIAIAFYFYNDYQKSLLDSSSPTQITAGEITGVLKCHFIDIGQGDCIFVELPDGNTMLIDSGKKGNGDKITEYVKNLGYTEIDILIATHSDSDHIGSMTEIFNNFEINYCYRPATYYGGTDAAFSDDFNVKPLTDGSFEKCGTKTYCSFLTALKNEGCDWEYFSANSDFYNDFAFELKSDDGTAQEISLSYTMDFLTPTAQVPNIFYSDSNDYSPICVLSYGDFDILFTGDAHENVEQELLKNYSAEYLKDVEVLKVGHHGSESSTCDAFVKAFTPEYAVIMCGVDNSYKHPRQKTLDTLSRNGVFPYRTDLQGTVVLTVDCEGNYEFSTEKTVENTSLLFIGQDAFNAL